MSMSGLSIFLTLTNLDYYKEGQIMTVKDGERANKRFGHSW